MLEPTKVLRDLIKRVLRLNDNEALFFITDLSIVQDFIIDLNTHEQLFKKGIGSTGLELPTYSQVSQDLFGKPDRAFTLNDTGDFYNTFEVIPTKKGYFLIIADGQKEDENILKKYSEFEVVGLTEDSQDKLATFMGQFVNDYIRETLNIQ